MLLRGCLMKNDMKTKFQTFRRFQLLAAVSLLASAGIASAAVTQYTDSAAFNAILNGGSETSAFTGLGPAYYDSPQLFDPGTFEFSVASQTTAGANNLYVTAVASTP